MIPIDANGFCKASCLGGRLCGGLVEHYESFNSLYAMEVFYRIPLPLSTTADFILTLNILANAFGVALSHGYLKIRVFFFSGLHTIADCPLFFHAQKFRLNMFRNYMQQTWNI